MPICACASVLSKNLPGGEADPDLKDRESRIKWGYSPQAEQRMRRDTAFMNDLSMDQYEPASIFRVEF